MVLPDLFCQRLKAILPQLTQNDVERFFSQPATQAFRVNTLKGSVDDVKGYLNGLGIPWDSVPWCAYALVVAHEHSAVILASDFVKQGLLYAQGLSSLLPVMVLDPKPGMRVLDLCAAPGSKTTQIAMHMNNEGVLAANDVVRDRFFRLKAVSELMGAKVQLSSVDGRRFQAREGLFDSILVDAPCSSEGRFRLGDAKSVGYWSERKIKEMAHKQKGLLLNASRLLSPGGSLVYATCTFAPEENEEAVDWLLRKTQGRLRVADISDWPGVTKTESLGQWRKRVYDAQVKGTLRILPDERTEGFFIAKFINSDYK